MYYSSFGLLALIIHLIINSESLMKIDSNNSALERTYRAFLFSVLFYYIVDIAWGFLEAWQLIGLLYADTVLYFVFLAFTVFFWTRYVVAYLNKDGSFSKIITWAGWLILASVLATLAVNFFVPIFFSFDADKSYHPRRARYIMLGILILLNLLTSVHTFLMTLKSEGLKKFRHRAMGIAGVVMSGFIVLQALDPFLPFYAIGCLITTCLIHEFVVAEDKLESHKELDSAKTMAYRDSLTGVKNVHAYAEATKCIDKRISEDLLFDFGVVVFDLNGLKEINDTLGHETGNKYIKNASSLICNQFKHSPVFRIGGDEFVVFLEGSDFQNTASLVEAFEQQIEQNQKEGLVVVASGFAEYILDEDSCYQTIFERADHKMYERKKLLKDMQNNPQEK